MKVECEYKDLVVDVKLYLPLITNFPFFISDDNEGDEVRMYSSSKRYGTKMMEVFGSSFAISKSLKYE